MATIRKANMKPYIGALLGEYFKTYGFHPGAGSETLSLLFGKHPQSEYYKRAAKQKVYNLKKKTGWDGTKPAPKENTEIRCPYCDRTDYIVKNGVQNSSLNKPPAQRYKCKWCCKTFTNNTQPTIYLDPLTGKVTKEPIDIHGNPIKKKPAPVKPTNEQKTIATLKEHLYSINLKVNDRDTKIDDLKKEIAELKKEVVHLKRTGIFPLEKKPDSNSNQNGVTCRIDLRDLINTDLD